MGRSEHSPTKLCLGCGYALDGLPEPRCPECGRDFDPRDGRTFRRGDDERLWIAPDPEEAGIVRDRLEAGGISVVVDGQEVRVGRADVDRARTMLREPGGGFRCPRCDEPMTPGYAWAEGGGGGLQPAGLVWAPGIPANRRLAGYRGDEFLVLTTPRQAHRCPDCLLLTIEPARAALEPEQAWRASDAYPVTCLACGEQMPAGESACPACGWSYEESTEAGREG